MRQEEKFQELQANSGDSTDRDSERETQGVNSEKVTNILSCANTNNYPIKSRREYSITFFISCGNLRK
ncbi:unnamed protein product [Allacma fusca]|uniref:Uncharacterized protein n=1 Tax=Allacma fusca TaxID=39272 RepID=A0A8J2P520_9HEXA|nr:unnamed protein product [Allacma fusca]